MKHCNKHTPRQALQLSCWNQGTGLPSTACQLFFQLLQSWSGENIKHTVLKTQMSAAWHKAGAHDNRQAPGSPFWLSPKGHNHSCTIVQRTGKERKFLKTVLVFVRFSSARLCNRCVFPTDHRRVHVSPTSENPDYSSLSPVQWVLLNKFHSMVWILWLTIYFFFLL